MPKFMMHPLLRNCPPVLINKYIHPLETGTNTRLFGLKGGRSSGKTQTALRYQMTKVLQNPKWRAVAGRTTDNRKDTIKQTLIEIQDIEHSHCGVVNTTDKYIEFQNGGRIELKGFNPEVPESARGFAGYDAILLDEAQWATMQYLKEFRDTLLRFRTYATLCYNPLVDDTISEFLSNSTYSEQILCNYLDNPMCPQSVIEQATKDKQTDYNYYLLNWLGQPLSASDMAVFQPHTIELLKTHASGFDFRAYIGALDFAPGSHDITIKTDDNVLMTFGVAQTRQIEPTDVLAWRDNDHLSIVGRVVAEYHRQNMQAIIVDSTGAGELVPDLLEQAGCNVIRFYGGDRSLMSDEDAKKYANNRAYSYFLAAQDARENRLFCTHEQTLKELGSQEYKYTVGGLRQMQPKSEIKKKTGRSPDHADAFVMGNLLYNKIKDDLVLDYSPNNPYNNIHIMGDDAPWR